MSHAEDLVEELGSFAYSSRAFVMWAFPWGETGTELEDEDGPDDWQWWVLGQVDDGLLSLDDAIRIAVTSGHGVGKSALVGWLVWWSFSTFPGTRGVVTANTENQLKTKTWVEIAKWHRLFIARDLFKCTATALFAQDEDKAREWRIDIVPWSERNTEAFAGLHNAGKRIIIIFDEASAIPDVIWETTEGALTDRNTEIMWFVFGNPTRNKGRFRECFDGGKFFHRWATREVNSLEAKRTNKPLLNQWVKDYGPDSDFCRVRIFGKFPREDAASFISRDLVTEAINRVILPQRDLPIVLGVDVARFGDDISVIWPRQGRDARSLPIQFFSGLSTTGLVQHIVHTYNNLGAACAMIDGGGVGGGVVDQCRQLGLNVYDVQFGSRPDGFDQSVQCLNKRAEIWSMMRSWLRDGAIPESIADRTLTTELTAPTYSLDAKDRIQLEAKSMMKARGERSPDFADALACTFAYPVAETVATMRAPRYIQDYHPFDCLYEETLQ